MGEKTVYRDPVAQSSKRLNRDYARIRHLKMGPGELPWTGKANTGSPWGWLVLFVATMATLAVVGATWFFDSETAFGVLSLYGVVGGKGVFALLLFFVFGLVLVSRNHAFCITADTVEITSSNWIRSRVRSVPLDEFVALTISAEPFAPWWWFHDTGSRIYRVCLAHPRQFMTVPLYVGLHPPGASYLASCAQTFGVPVLDGSCPEDAARLGDLLNAPLVVRIRREEASDLFETEPDYPPSLDVARGDAYEEVSINPYRRPNTGGIHWVRQAKWWVLVAVFVGGLFLSLFSAFFLSLIVYAWLWRDDSPAAELRKKHPELRDLIVADRLVFTDRALVFLTVGRLGRRPRCRIPYADIESLQVAPDSWTGNLWCLEIEVDDELVVVGGGLAQHDYLWLQQAFARAALGHAVFPASAPHQPFRPVARAEADTVAVKVAELAAAAPAMAQDVLGDVAATVAGFPPHLNTKETRDGVAVVIDPDMLSGAEGGSINPLYFVLALFVALLCSLHAALYFLAFVVALGLVALVVKSALTLRQRIKSPPEPGEVDASRVVLMPQQLVLQKMATRGLANCLRISYADIVHLGVVETSLRQDAWCLKINQNGKVHRIGCGLPQEDLLWLRNAIGRAALGQRILPVVTGAEKTRGVV